MFRSVAVSRPVTSAVVALPIGRFVGAHDHRAGRGNVISSLTLGNTNLASFFGAPPMHLELRHLISEEPTFLRAGQVQLQVRDHARGDRRSLRTMAGNGSAFPAETKDVQTTQPGIEHIMDPAPRHDRPYTPANKLQGKVALITGGDSGIGKAVARLFSLEGASVAITYVPNEEEKDAADALDTIRKVKVPEAKDPIKIAIDLGYDENCKKVVDEVVQHFGKIDILVNNAAEQHMVENFEDIDPAQVERVFRTNIFSQFFLSRHALKHMGEGSSIINTTSINAYKGNKSLIDYTSTKGAIVAFTRALSLHLAPRKIRVNGVAPGPIWTPLIPATMGSMESFGHEVPMQRAGQPDEVATSYVFLASEDASYFSGQVLHPNGGVPLNT